MTADSWTVSEREFRLIDTSLAILVPASGEVERHALPVGTRAWFTLLVAWMAGLAAAAVWLLALYDSTEDPIALRAWILVLMCFYLTLCNSFVPLPTAWIVLLAARPEYALINNVWLNVLLVAGLSTGATILANLNEYHLLAFLTQAGVGRRVRRTRLYGWAARWFDRSPFQILSLIAFIPIPVDAVRWLAILRGYSRVRFALAYLVGRGPRYLLFASCSVILSLSNTQIFLIQCALVAGAIGARLAVRILRPAITSPTANETA